MLSPLKRVLKSTAEWLQRNGFYRMAANARSWEPTHTGKQVDQYTALNCSVVYACTRNIAETLGSLPFVLMQTVKGTTRDVPASEDKLADILRGEPNPDTGAMEFVESLTGHGLNWGNGYAEIVRRSGDDDGEVIGLWQIPPDAVRIEMKGRELSYKVREGGTERTLHRGQMLHLRGFGFDGVTGYSVIEMARHSIALSQAAEEYGSRYFGSGGNPRLALKYPHVFRSEEDAKKFREKFNETYGGMGNHGVAILEGGSELQTISLPPEEMQFLETRAFQVPEICRWYRMDPHMVQDHSRSTFSNVEHLAIQAVQYTYRPWAKRWEGAIQRCVLSSSQKAKGYFVKINLDALLRGDFATRMAGYSTALQNGWLNRNEVRNLEGRNPIDGGDQYTIQLNMQELVDLGNLPDDNPRLKRVSEETR